MEILEIVIGLWLVWALGNFVLMLSMPFWLQTNTAYTNGITVFVPQDWCETLTPRQLDAVLLHEQGHKHHLHPWKNLLRVWFFVPRSREDAEQQELEADDFAAARGYGRDLAGALRCYGCSALDHQRAVRLELLNPPQAVEEPGLQA